MTLKEIIEMALDELRRPIDALSSLDWLPRMTRYANEAVLDITCSFRPWQRSAALITDGRIDLATLPDKCQKVLSVERDGRGLTFYYGCNLNELIVKDAADGEAVVTYRYIPPELKELNDRPKLPEFLHPLIAAYMAARERVLLDSSAQGGIKLNLTMYETLKRRLRLNMDEPDSSRFYGCY